jgi:hypothetical protein
MKIAIFGDSYTRYNMNPGNEHLGLSWVEHLDDIHEVTNFGKPGASFRWCYELFLEHKDNFDFCIVVVPDPFRIWIKALDNVPNKMEGHFWAAHEFRNEFKNRTSDERIHQIIDSVSVWYDNWRDHLFENHLHHLMVKDMLSYANVLAIPGSPDSIKGYSKHYQNLTDIQFWELLQVDPDFNFTSMHCKRKCHLTEENNYVLYSLVLDAISKKQKVLNLNIKHFVKPTRELEYYALQGDV